MLYSLIPITK